jgi:peptidoglycan-associated lipoprotein
MRRYTVHRHSTTVGILAIVSALSLIGGCKSKSAVKDMPQTVEGTVTATLSAPNKVEYIQVNPWSLDAGGAVEILAGGTPGRTASVTLKGLAGDASGTTRVEKMQEVEPGKYRYAFPESHNLPSGEYQIEVELSGGAGEPNKLTSSRRMAIKSKPKDDPQAVACLDARAVFGREPLAYFEFNRDQLTPAAQSAIESAGARLRGFADRIKRLSVEGHCDERGSTEYNLDLASRRARNVQAALGRAAGGAVTIEVIPYGEERPMVPNARTEADHAKNRRAVLALECLVP